VHGGFHEAGGAEMLAQPAGLACAAINANRQRRSVATRESSRLIRRSGRRTRDACVRMPAVIFGHVCIFAIHVMCATEKLHPRQGGRVYPLSTAAMDSMQQNTHENTTVSSARRSPRAPLCASCGSHPQPHTAGGGARLRREGLRAPHNFTLVTLCMQP
jgi:hypothetical protein